jgi:hypothetical protein
VTDRVGVIAHARKLRSQAQACCAYSRLLVANSADLQRTFDQLRIVALLRSLGLSATLNPIDEDDARGDIPG